jgi:hypothetical protein
MTDGNSVVNLGDISQPVTVLIEKVSSAVGFLYEPTHVKRMARAEAEAEKIKALARIELSEIEKRTMDRFLHQEVRKQINIEQITAQAIDALPMDAKVDDLQEDWIVHFFKQCETVSDKEMQSVWSRLLAGEATSPGTFSKRTVDFISSIDKSEAALFTKFCQFVWLIGEPTPVVFDVSDSVYEKQGITFDSLKHLDAIGLISLEVVSGYCKIFSGKFGRISYGKNEINVEFRSDEKNEMNIGVALFTSIGKELVPICGSTTNDDFCEYVVRKWFDKGLVMSSLISQN